MKSERHARYAHHITLEHLLIRGYGNNQQTVGISTKCPAWNWVIRHNTIIGAGTGMYLGDSDGSAPFVAGVIERNLIVDTIGYNLQIKHQRPRPDVAGMPVDASVTVIRHNVFANPGGGSPAAPRPNVLVGHFPLEGAGVDDRYVIYGNFFYRNRYEALFQGEGNVALYDNLFVNPDGDAIHIQPHNDVPKRVDIAFNTVLAGRVGISVVASERSISYAQTVVANVVFAALPIAGGTTSGNFTGPYADADRHLARPFAAPGQMDLYPSARWANPGARGATESGGPPRLGSRLQRPAPKAGGDRRLRRQRREPGDASGACADAGLSHASACSISRIRSSTCSTPIDRRTRSAGHSVPGPSTLARCSARLSTDPSDVARLKTRSLAVKDFAAPSPLARRSDIMPPNPPRICLAAIAWPGCEGNPGYSTCASFGWPSNRRAIAAAFALAAATRSASVRMPRSSSQASTGPSTAPPPPRT